MSRNDSNLRRLLLAAAIVAATLAAYWPAIHGGFIWDDDDYLTGNRALRSAEGLKEIWLVPGTTRQYYPLVHTTFWLESRLWGFEPLGYHLVNVFLFAASALLLWQVLERLSLPGAWFVAAVFALHPVHVESVAWITERKNVLSGLLYLAAAAAYLRFHRSRVGPVESSRGAWGTYALSLLLFAGALASKTVTASLPAALLLLHWWKGDSLNRRTVFPLLPMFVLALPMARLTAWMETYNVGARGADWDLSFVERTLIAGRALWFYAGKLIWPDRLTFIYPRWEIDAGAAWQYLFPVAALLVVIGLWALRGRLGRGPLVAVLFFAGTLVPALGFFDVYPMKYSFVADHFQYLASIGLIALVSTAGLRLLRFAVPGDRATVVAAMIVLAVLGTLSWRQARIYENVETLWRDTIDKNSACWMARVSLGNELERTGRSDEALVQYREALRHDPDSAMAHNNVGVILFNRKRYDEAETHFRRAFEIDPNDGMVQANLGDIARIRGDLDLALKRYAESLTRRPDHASSHYWIGLIHLQRDDVEAAVSHLEAALRIDPGMEEAARLLRSARP